jgi:hypothetical protein
VTAERAPDVTGGLFGDREVALVDLLDRVLSAGVVLAGDVTISLAGVDLIRISLRALVTSIAPAEPSVEPAPVEWTAPQAIEARGHDR